MTFSRAVVSARIDDGRKRGFAEDRGDVDSLLAKPAARSEAGRAEAAEQVEKRAAREAIGRERDKGRKDTIFDVFCVRSVFFVVFETPDVNRFWARS